MYYVDYLTHVWSRSFSLGWNIFEVEDQSKSTSQNMYVIVKVIAGNPEIIGNQINVIPEMVVNERKAIKKVFEYEL